jgi:SAM-dependent MidA family methyltransferase
MGEGLLPVKPPTMNSPTWPWNDSGKLRFDRFMDLALHHPGRGYYARRIRGVGQSGDFTTTPMLTPALGKAVAVWAEEALRSAGCRHLIELGPGEGKLARAVLHELTWWRRLRTTVHLVETSVPLRTKQQSVLGHRVLWHDSLAAALEACGGRACIYSNEFADAFPVRRFRRESDGWSELYLTPAEQWEPSDGLPDSSVFELAFPPGQIVEVAEAYRAWLGEWLPSWRAGRMLTIDYGSEVGGLYHRRPRGSLRAYFMQQRLEGPAAYENPGRQDLTADVNFTDLQRWSAPWLETVGLRTQRDFLLPHADPAQPSDAHAVETDGAGSAFLVLDQRCLAQRAD